MATSHAPAPPPPPQKPPNLIRPCGSSWSECGYCKGERAGIVDRPPDGSSRAYTVLGEHLAPSLYQDGLVERGWRRSGRALYRPDNWASCCPALTIRLPVADFVPTKKQRQLLRRVERIADGHSSCFSPPPPPPPHGDDNERAPTLPLSFSSKRHKVASRTTRVDLEESGVLLALVEATRRSLRQCLPAHIQQSMELLPINFKVVSTKRKVQQGSSEAGSTADGRSSGSAVVVMATSICAAVAGRASSRKRAEIADGAAPAIHRNRGASSTGNASVTLDRGALSVQLASTLQTSLFAPQSNYLKEPTEQPPSRCDTLTVVRVEAHRPSGQVLVHLIVPSSNMFLDAPSSSDRNDFNQCSSSSVRSQGGNKEATMNMSPLEGSPMEPPSDKFSEWWIQQWSRLSLQGASKPGDLVLPWAAPPSPPHELTITTLTAHESALDPAVHQLYCRYQHAVHGDPDPFDFSAVNGHGTPVNDATEQTPNGAGADGMGGHDYSWADKAPLEWRQLAKAMLYSTYGSLSKSQQAQLIESYGHFYEFLVENPFAGADQITITLTTSFDRAQSMPPGAYHQHYKVGDLLVAVGVVDVLPQGLSSVYLFYEPSFARDVIPLGKYAILKEIEFARNQLRIPYYYLGYYIESCPKMRYKAEYHPSELLCPATLQWVDAATAQRTLVRDSPERHCCRLAPVGDEAAAPSSPAADQLLTVSPSDDILSQIPLDVGIGRSVTFQMLTPPGQELLRPHLQEFVSHAGNEVALQCTLGFR